MLPNLTGLPVPGTGAPCTPAAPAAPPSDAEKEAQDDQATIDGVLNSESQWPVEKDRYYTETDGDAPRGSRSFVLSQPLVDMLDYYVGMNEDGLLDALLQRKLGAALTTCIGVGQQNAKLVYLDVDAPPAVAGVSSERLKDTAVITIGVKDVHVLFDYYQQTILGTGLVKKAVNWVTGADKPQHAHACIPVHVFITCEKEKDSNNPQPNDEIETRRLNIELSKHLAPFVVLAEEGTNPKDAKKTEGALSNALVAFVLRKLNPIMKLPNLPRKFEQRPWRMLYDDATLKELDEDQDALAAADSQFGLKTLVEVRAGSGWAADKFANWLNRF